MKYPGTHERNLQIYKQLISSYYRPHVSISRKFFNLKNFQQLASSMKKTTKMGLETISYCGPQLWNLVPQEIKESTPFLIFKDKIKKWNCTNCQSRLCHTFLVNIHFM